MIQTHFEFRVNIFSLVCRMIHKWKLWECVAYSWHSCTECGSARVRDSRHPRSPRRMFDLMTVPFQPETASLRFPGISTSFLLDSMCCRRRRIFPDGKRQHVLTPQVSLSLCVYITISGHTHTRTSYYVEFWLQLCARSKSKNKCRIDLVKRTNYTRFRESLPVLTGAQRN